MRPRAPASTLRASARPRSCSSASTRPDPARAPADRQLPVPPSRRRGRSCRRPSPVMWPWYAARQLDGGPAPRDAPLRGAGARRLETGRLAFGHVEPWAPLDSRSHEPGEVRALRELIGRRPESGNLVLVTHGSVIRPLTGIRPATAELVVLTPEGAGHFRVAG